MFPPGVLTSLRLQPLERARPRLLGQPLLALDVLGQRVDRRAQLLPEPDANIGQDDVHQVIQAAEELPRISALFQRVAEVLFRLAQETGVVLLPGNGFEVVDTSARVSLANLTDIEYAAIGKFTRQVLDEYNQDYINSKAKPVAATKVSAPAIATPASTPWRGRATGPRHDASHRRGASN